MFTPEQATLRLQRLGLVDEHRAAAPNEVLSACLRARKSTHEFQYIMSTHELWSISRTFQGGRNEWLKWGGIPLKIHTHILSCESH